MKTTAAIAVVTAAALSGASAFTLDFTSVGIANTPNNLVVNVVGYGNVQLSSTLGSVKTVYDFEVNKIAMQIDNGEYVTVKFMGNPGVSLTGVDASSIDTLSLLNGTPNTFVFQFAQTGTSPTTNIRGISFVPEPSTALLGALGSLLLFRRRRD